MSAPVGVVSSRPESTSSRVRRPTHIVIEGVQFRNKGAELMLAAVAAELTNWPSTVHSIRAMGSFEQRAAYGARTLLHSSRLRPAANWLAGRLLPAKAKQRFGIMGLDNVSVVLDAAGFRYSDQWGIDLVRKATDLYRVLRRRNGAKIVLLPQAFGPFSTAGSREAIRQLLGEVELVFARDSVSYESLLHAAPGVGNIHKAPDITIGLAATTGPRLGPGSVAIVPNRRMLDKTDRHIREQYPGFFADAVEIVIQAGRNPVLVVHQLDDLDVARQMAASASRSVEVRFEEDPIGLKCLLGSADFVLSSRFHGALNALCQGVPCIATSWSHKYEELFSEFGVPEYVVSVRDRERLRRCVGLLTCAPAREQVVATLRRTTTFLEQEVRGMWAKVRQAVGVASGPSAP
jgi:polysaccharide pyruvyl transferase WcaK-like protein